VFYFILGVLTSFLAAAIIKGRSKLQASDSDEIDISFNQTNVYQFMKAMLLSGAFDERETQSRIHSESKPIRFVQTHDNRVYWLVDDVVYMTNVINDSFDPEKGEPIDTKNLSKEEVDKLLAILDALQNG
jgi:hypothetical protein